MHRKHGIDRGTEAIWLFKLSYQNFEMPDPIWGSNSPLFGIWFGVFPIGTARRPIQYEVSYPKSRLWTVGIASVGTESVRIAWCTSWAV